jgi:uncharacterized Zn finger protein
MADTVYDGVKCPSCRNTKYTVVKYGNSWYKKCVECGRLSSIKEGDLVNWTPPE